MPRDDPAGRRWELQAASMQECVDWIASLRQASQGAAKLAGHAAAAALSGKGRGAPTIVHQA